MKKFLKILGTAVLVLILLIAGFAVYIYQTNDRIRAIVQNDESRLYYFPVKEMDDLSEFKYSESELLVNDTDAIFTYQFPAGSVIPLGNVFFIHGSGGNVSRYKELIRPLVAHGFNVYAFDWRGFGKSDGTPLHKNVLSDSQLAFKDFLSKSSGNSVPTIVYGMSLGGQVAVRIARENESVVDALVLDGCIESFQSLAIDQSPVKILKDKARNNPQDFNWDYAAINEIKDVKGVPKLIIQSQDDRVVPFARGENLFHAAQEPKIFWKTTGEHILTLKNHPEETIQRIKALLN